MRKKNQQNNFFFLVFLAFDTFLQCCCRPGIQIQCVCLFNKQTIAINIVQKTTSLIIMVKLLKTIKINLIKVYNKNTAIMTVLTWPTTDSSNRSNSSRF